MNAEASSGIGRQHCNHATSLSLFGPKRGFGKRSRPAVRGHPGTHQDAPVARRHPCGCAARSQQSTFVLASLAYHAPPCRSGPAGLESCPEKCYKFNSYLCPYSLGQPSACWWTQSKSTVSTSTGSLSGTAPAFCFSFGIPAPQRPMQGHQRLRQLVVGLHVNHGQ